MDSLLDFTGKTAIVTGGRRGLGKAMATALAERGADVVVIAKNAEPPDFVAKRIRYFSAALAGKMKYFVHGQTLIVDGGFTGN